MKTYTLPQIKNIYNDYRNNYLTTTRIAEDYQTTPQTIQRMIRKINIYYNVIGTTITIYKAVNNDTLQLIECIEVNKPKPYVINVREFIQSKHPEYIINRLNQ